MIDGIDHINLAGRFIADALAAEGMKNNSVVEESLERPVLFGSLIKEVQVGLGIAAAVEPDVKRDPS